MVNLMFMHILSQNPLIRFFFTLFCLEILSLLLFLILEIGHQEALHATPIPLGHSHLSMIPITGGL